MAGEGENHWEMEILYLSTKKIYRFIYTTRYTIVVVFTYFEFMICPLDKANSQRLYPLT
jgi:hypothetical protein